MERVQVTFCSEKTDDIAQIYYDGRATYLCAKGRKVMVAEGEIYDLITTFMSQFFEDFTEKKE